MSYSSGASAPRAIQLQGNPRHRGASIDSGYMTGRSYVYSSFKPDMMSALGESPEVHSPDSVHEDTANLAEVGMNDEDVDSAVDPIDVVDVGGEGTVPWAPGYADSEPYPNSSGISQQARQAQQAQQARQASQASQMSQGTTGADQSGVVNADSMAMRGDSESLRRIYTNQMMYGAIGQAIEEPPIEDTTRSNSSHTAREGSVSTGIHALPEAPRDEESLVPSGPAPWELWWNAVKNADRDTIVQECVKRPVGYIPAVFLGCLLNILDALSYGMIMFPLSEEVFSDMAPTGLSMFYVSTILSQLVFSLGGSAFKSAIGSEMIEVTPFFHKMAISIMHKLDGDKQAVVATTLVTFAFSSIITGLCFSLLGRFKLGKLVGFFPRHILVGCVGGVGYFLVITAIEVSSRIDGGIEYNRATLEFLLEPLVFLQWVIPLLLTVLLVFLQGRIHSPLLVPTYIIVIFVAFHLLVYIVPNWNLQIARDYGWVFAAQESNTPWYEFYDLYMFSKVDWWAVLGQIPTIFALTFFGVLHVPINVPALALSIGMDEFDVDRELLAHGVSNVLSGLIGSIQNYLVYTNSVLFIRAGADSRLSGVMLAIATALVMFSGPGIIGFIPVCVVGTLIYLLGYELLKEALWDTIGRLRKFEYITIVIIVITMGAVDFVVGILVGILLACVSFVIDAGSKRVVTGVYTGEYARSIVIRHPKQQEFLKRVGRQTVIFKLSGSLFFGSIGGLEERVRARFEEENFKVQPIKYLILDMNGVLGIDFSAAEGFRRIRNLLLEKKCYLVISSVNEDSVIVQALEDCGLWENEEHKEMIQLFNNLNSALEWCENRFLQSVQRLSEKKRGSSQNTPWASVGMGQQSQQQQQQQQQKLQQQKGSPHSQQRELPIALFDGATGSTPDAVSPVSASPRNSQLLKAAQKSLKSEHQQNLQMMKDKMLPSSALKKPLPLILKVMQGITDKPDEAFWNKLCRYLVQVRYQAGTRIYDKGTSPVAIYFFESGRISYSIEFKNLRFSLKSSVVPLTLFGDLVKTTSERRISFTASTDSTLWKLDGDNLQKLIKENRELYEELLIVSLRLGTLRADSIASNILISA